MLSEKYVLILTPLIDDIAKVISLVFSKKIYTDEARRILDFIMLISVCWNVANVTLKKDSVAAGILKGSIMLFFGMLLIPALMESSLSLGRNRVEKVIIAVTIIAICTIIETSIWDVLKKEI